MSADPSVNHLPEGWELCALGEIAKTSSGGTPSSKNAAYYGGGTPWVKIGDLNDDFVSDTEKTITVEGLKNSSAKLVPAGTLLVAMYGSIGKLGILGMEAATNQAICAIRPDENKVLTKYLFWFLMSERSSLMDAGRGGTQLNISQGDLKEWPVVVPPIKEQESLVAAIDAASANLSAGLASLGRARQGSPRAELALLSSVFGATDAEKNGQSRSIEDIAEVIRGVTFSKTEVQQKSGVGLVPVLRSGNVQRELILEQDLVWAPSERVKEKQYLTPGDIVVSVSNSYEQLGKAALVGSEWFGSFGAFLATMRPDPAQVLPEYLWLFTRSAQWRAQVLAAASATNNIANINSSKLRAIRLPVPPLAQQEQLVATLKARLDALDALRRELESAERRGHSLFRAILDRAMSGELLGEKPAPLTP